MEREEADASGLLANISARGPGNREVRKRGEFVV